METADAGDLIHQALAGLIHGIVDLHRADKRVHVPERWKVKDIAALNYSAPRKTISRSDRLRFLKTYLGTERLGETGKRFALKVLKKTEKMIKHNRKKSK